MAEIATFPYTTHRDIKFGPLTLIDVSSLAKTVTDAAPDAPAKSRDQQD
jgi:hypothetical protein